MIFYISINKWIIIVKLLIWQNSLGLTVIMDIDDMWDLGNDHPILN